MTARAKIAEIFKSVQGEGIYAGISQVFIRFYGCNIRCSWCDTPEAVPLPGPVSRGYRERREWTPREVLDTIRRLGRGCHSVSLTGGEPLLQARFLCELLPKLKREKKKIYLDTNGVLCDAFTLIAGHVDTVAMDIKLPSSAGTLPLWKEHAAFLWSARKKDVFIKMVVGAHTRLSDVTRAVEVIRAADPRLPVVLQPNTAELRSGALRRCLRFQDYCLKSLSDVRVIPQMHKILGVR